MRIADRELEIDGRRLPSDSTLLVASGTCCLCDSRFRDEPALAWPDPKLPGGAILVELRHLDSSLDNDPDVDPGSTRR